MSRTWYSAIVYLSLAGALVVLYRGDYLHVPVVRDPLRAAASVMLLLAGFFLMTVVWQRALERIAYPVSLAAALASTGLTVFGKYLPGKIWTVVGRAAYVAAGDPRRLVAASAASAGLQVVSLWVGIGVGLPALAGADADGILALSAAWLVLSPLAFAAPVRRAATALASRVRGRPVTLPLLSIPDALSLVPWLVAAWLAWAAGFVLFAGSLVAGPVPWLVGLAFPLAACVGMLAIFLPGGLGAREAVIVSALVLAGVTLRDATAVAVAARLWFILGEVASFVAGLAAHRLAVGARAD